MRRPLAVAFCALALGSCGTNGSPAVPLAEVPIVSSAKPDRLRVEQAKRDGHLTVPLTISVRLGRDEEVEQALTKLGATIESRDPRIGYLRAEMPVDKVEDAYLISGVSAVDVEEPLNNRLPEP
ncbi:hypothetical protein ACSHWB_08290 [Lentzea sp. HUAS TT2]|uniref:hypothetical protein n=1 Tax=Lentzea sp. HUAS TT2 TaxID=3447454 RepID=UPI003F70D3FC